MKNKIIKWLLYLIFPILFNVVYFLLDGVCRSSSAWVSYAWIQVSYIFMIVTPLVAGKKQSNKTLYFTIILISSIYFAIELILGVKFIFIKINNVKLSIIIHAILFGVYLIILLCNLLLNDNTANNEKKRALEVSFIKTASSKAKILMDFVEDLNIKKKLEKIYDLIHTSPSKSYSSVKEYENNVITLLNELNGFLQENNYNEANKIIAKIQFNMEERNRIVMLCN